MINCYSVYEYSTVPNTNLWWFMDGSIFSLVRWKMKRASNIPHWEFNPEPKVCSQYAFTLPCCYPVQVHCGNGPALTTHHDERAQNLCGQTVVIKSCSIVELLMVGRSISKYLYMHFYTLLSFQTQSQPGTPDTTINDSLLSLSHQCSVTILINLSTHLCSRVLYLIKHIQYSAIIYNKGWRMVCW